MHVVSSLLLAHPSLPSLPPSPHSLACHILLTPQGEDDEGAGLFHARVLLAEADHRSAKKMKQMLENAGYMVTVEGDGKQVFSTVDIKPVHSLNEWYRGC